jgi:putative hydrolase of the HAD superfamily
MIKTIIFDFGDVFINLDKEGILYNALNIFGIDSFPAAMLKTNALYEMGLITTDSFLKFYTNEFPHVSKKSMINLWNSILKDFPIHRLDFLNELSKQKDYKLILLSNTNTLHIDWIIEHVPFYEEFKNCFDAFYLSHEIHLRKPNRDIYEFVLNKNSIKPEECLFIDDTAENTDTAKSIGIHTWNINPKNEDVINLFTVNHHLF